MTRRQLAKALAAVAGYCAASSGAALAAQTRTPSARGVQSLMREPLEPIADPEVNVIILNLPPGSQGHPHEHIGPVFAYILEGAIENQVDPNAPQTYRAGDYFYEPARHVHRIMRNLSATRPARVLVFEVGSRGQTFTIPAPK